MCTLSWWIDRERRGVLFNRDEKRTRKHGLPPELVQRSGGLSVLAPVDPEAGGTWLGVNEAGLIAGLLNYYPYQQGEVPDRISRGMLVMDLLHTHERADAALAALGPEVLRRYRGFILFIMDRAGSPHAASWDGTAWKALPVEKGRGMLSTSSVDPAGCDRVRGGLFSRIPREPAALRSVHQFHDPSAPAHSPLMIRSDAATDSITEIVVDASAAAVRFQAVRGDPPVIGAIQERHLLLSSGNASG